MLNGFVIVGSSSNINAWFVGETARLQQPPRKYHERTQCLSWEKAPLFSKVNKKLFYMILLNYNIVIYFFQSTLSNFKLLPMCLPGSFSCPTMKCWKFSLRPRTHCGCNPTWRSVLRVFQNWTSYPIWISRQGSHKFSYCYLKLLLKNFYDFLFFTAFAQAMYSSEGERVKLIQHISTSEANGAVEKWLAQVEDVMVHSVRDVLARSRLVRSLFPVTQIIHSTMMLLNIIWSCCFWIKLCISTTTGTWT